MPLIAGNRLGPYEVVAPLGAGGMGEVYRARDPRLGRDVAIKVLPAGLAQDAERLRRFEQEARAVGALNHPYILAIFDTGSHEGSPYVVSELLEGQTLRDRLAGGPLVVRKAVEIAVQIARGLGAAHEKGIVHRDLKPENVFLTRDGHVKILDFGLAKLMEPFGEDDSSALATRTRGTDAGTVLGTAGYMSPEQVRAQAVDHRSDLFSLGAVLYEMLSGRRAFKRDTSADTMAAILNEEPPDMTAVNPALPPALARIVQHCLEKDRDERFASARDLAFDLQSLSESGSGPGRIAAARGGRGVWRWSIALLLWSAAVAAVSFWLGRTGESMHPSYRPLTFRRGTVTSARFSPDGSYFFYSAAWSGGPARVYTTRLDVPGDQDLGLDGDLVAVAAGEMFVLRSDRVLVRATLAGQGAREVAEEVTAADVSADGTRIAIVRRVLGRDRLECPLGKAIYETTGEIQALRFAPRGDRLAVLESPQEGILLARVGVLDLEGRMRSVTAVATSSPPVWSPDGQEVWFTDSGSGGHTLRAVSLSGRERILLTAAQRPVLQDVKGDGRRLVTFRDRRQGEVRGLMEGMAAERDFVYLDGPQCFEIAPDGRTLVLSSLATVGAAPFSVYLGTFGDTPPVRLGPGFGGGMSPDGRLVAVMGEKFSTLALLPTGPGTTKKLPAGTIKDYYDARFLPDGRSLLIAGSEAGRPRRLFLQDLDGGLPRPVTPESVTTLYSIPSPDGQWATAGTDWKAAPDSLYPLRGGEPRPIPGLVKGEQPLRFDADGTHLFIRTDGQDHPFARIARLDLRSGRKEPWKEIRPPDPEGVPWIDFVFLGPGGRSYVYSYSHDLSTLYLVEGLR